MGIRKQIRLYKKFFGAVYKARRTQQQGQVHLYNFWPDASLDTVWLSRFVRHHHLLTRGITLGFWSVFGDRDVIKSVSDDINVFYTGENIHWEHYQRFIDYMLSSLKIDFALGFDYFEHPRYMRLPFWIVSTFGNCLTYEDVCQRCEQLRYPKIESKTKSVAAVASWDPEGIRGKIADDFAKYTNVDYAGKWRHNDDTLKTQFADNKQTYLQQYIFNICPENSNSFGYVTEKIWDAISAGCIPVYSGSYNQPELEILNPNAILFFDPKTSTYSFGKQNCYGSIGGGHVVDLQQFIKDKEQVDSILSLSRLQPHAEDIIWQMMLDFKERLKQIIDKHALS